MFGSFRLCDWPVETEAQRKERRKRELHAERRRITERLLAIETELSELD